MISYNVLIVDHGKVFNLPHWYTFHCPYCNEQITRGNSIDKCEHCNRDIKWEDKED